MNAQDLVRSLMDTESECISCGAMVRPAAWFCREHYLLKEARYGIYDLEQKTPGFEDWGLKRVREYIDYMGEKP